MTTWSRLVIVLLFVAAGCGGSNTSNPSAPSSTPSAPQQPFDQTVAGFVGVLGTAHHSLSTPRGGTLTLTLTWGDSTVDLRLFLQHSCLLQGVAGICVDAFGTKGVVSERIVYMVGAGEVFDIVVGNNSFSRSQGYTITINIS